MSRVVATAERVVHAPAEKVRAALADYEGARRRILPEQFSDYRVESGGAGAGTRVHWRVAAAPQRGRGPPGGGREPAAGTPGETHPHPPPGTPPAGPPPPARNP